MMIRAGKREEVLTSSSMWNCTSCYNCIVRCPRKLRSPHHARIAEYAHRIGMAPKMQPTRFFSACSGRTAPIPDAPTNSSCRWLVLQGRLGAGIKNGLAMQAVALGLVKASA